MSSFKHLQYSKAKDRLLSTEKKTRPKIKLLIATEFFQKSAEIFISFKARIKQKYRLFVLISPLETERLLRIIYLRSEAGGKEQQ